MSQQECDAFKENPYLREIIMVRYWDDEGKDPNMITASFEYYAPLLQRVVDGA
jgi:predicted HD phosphohydrolase